ncbi:hypothetical protein SGPA1_41221 [Streptomyces misionensis JCM 4497]
MKNGTVLRIVSERRSVLLMMAEQGTGDQAMQRTRLHPQ